MKITRVAMLLGCVAFAATAATARDIVIGQCLPLSGILASSGDQLRVGAKIYFDHVNDTGGVHGARIRQVVLDDGYKVEETVRLTRRLLEQEGAVALLGFAGTANVAEVLRQGLLERHRVPLLAPISGAEALRNPPNPYVFHIRAGYADEAEHIVNHLVTIGIAKIGVFYQNDGFGKAGLAGVEAALAKRGLKLAVAGAYERNTDDVGAAVAAIKTAELGAVVMFSVNRPTAAFAKRYRSAGGAAQLLNISVVDPAQLVKLAGAATVHGLAITQVVPFPYAPNLPLVREYHAMLNKYGPTGSTPSYAGLEAYVGAKVLVEALRRAGRDPQPDAVGHALEGINQLDVGGFFVGFSKSSRVGSRFIDITVIGRDGKLLR
jgi:branched-chain amino acid transport system substrate-binding protein